MADNLVLFCKSYRDDVMRARRLADSIARFNRDGIPFFMSVPAADVELFRDELKDRAVTIVADHDVVSANPRFDAAHFAALPGGIAQQVVKAEFWRLAGVANYVCLDSDCYFIRSFGRGDFLAPDDTPYTVMHESKALLAFAAAAGLSKIAVNRAATRRDLMAQFGREGRLWDFGPIPVVWSSVVWRDLDERYLRPRNMTIAHAIATHPAELSWYGEALLALKSIPLLPIEPLFRCYHYEEEYLFAADAGETDETLAASYLGVCRQSNWDKQLDRVRKFKFSRLMRRIKWALRG